MNSFGEDTITSPVLPYVCYFMSARGTLLTHSPSTRLLAENVGDFAMTSYHDTLDGGGMGTLYFSLSGVHENDINCQQGCTEYDMLAQAPIFDITIHLV